jgi:anaerobic selenocysteine-containing dehydrogenase
MLSDAEPPRKLENLERSAPKDKAVCRKAFTNSLKYVNHQAGPTRGAQALYRMNQIGFDYPSCAWPDPDGERSSFEFCENGAKAISTETTKKRVGPEFFAKHSIAELVEQADFWLNDAGRITTPMVLEKDATHY